MSVFFKYLQTFSLKCIYTYFINICAVPTIIDHLGEKIDRRRRAGILMKLRTLITHLNVFRVPARVW